jgi:cell surface protein SprA
MGQPISTSESRTITRPSFFVSGDIIEKIGIPDDALSQAKFISDNFEKNFVSFPFPTWTLNLTGVEKFEMFSGFAQSMTIESGYSTEYKKVFTYDGRSPEIISALALTSSFSPLVGVSISFKPISDGTLTASFKLGAGNNYNIEPNNNARITNTGTSDLSINASYTKSGFKIPLFGLALDNNLTIGLSYTRTKNEPLVYELDIVQGIWSQNAQSGSTTTTTLNPQFNTICQAALSSSCFTNTTR